MEILLGSGLPIVSAGFPAKVSPGVTALNKGGKVFDFS
jgi:hypothetical protein